MAYMRLGDLLVASGTITGQQLERALALQKETCLLYTSEPADEL